MSYPPIDVLLATMDTPAATEAAIATVRFYHPGMELRVFIRTESALLHWVRPLAERHGATVVHAKNHSRHDHAITGLYFRGEAPYVLTLDSDVTLHGRVLDQMLAPMEADSRIFAVGLDGPEPVGHALFNEWSGDKQWGMTGFFTSPRLPIHFALWRRSTLLDRAVKTFGFYCGISAVPTVNDTVGTYYDTGGLLTESMRVAGGTDVYIPNNFRMKHWQSISWGGGRYERHEHVFKKIISDHPVEKPDGKPAHSNRNTSPQ